MAYAVYALIDPRDTLPYYIGMSADVYKRYGQHLAEINPNNPAKTARTEELRQANLLPILQVLEGEIATAKEARAKERHWITSYLQEGLHLTNKRQKIIAYPTITTVIPRLFGSSSDKGMTEDEARRLFKQYGWIWRIRPRHRTGILYLYAERWGEQQKKVERYIAPLSRLPQLSEQELIYKLTRS